MDAQRTQRIKVGMLMLISLALLAAAIFSIGEQSRFWQGKVGYEIRFARTNGLLVGAPVSLSGVTVGSVTDMVFPPDVHAQYVAVTISVAGNVASRIREDTLARIKTLGLLGDKFIELTVGTPEAPPLPIGTVILSIDPIDYEALLGQSGDIVTNIIEVTSSLRNVLESIDRGEGLVGVLFKDRKGGEAALTNMRDTLDHLEETTASLQRIITRVERGEGLVGSLLKDPHMGEDILASLRRSSSQLEKFSTELNSGDGILPVLLRDQGYGRALLADIQSVAKNLAHITEKIDRGEGTLGALLNDPVLYREMRELVRTTNESALYAFYRGLKNLWPFTGKPAPAEEKSGTKEKSPAP